MGAKEYASIVNRAIWDKLKASNSVFSKDFVSQINRQQVAEILKYKANSMLIGLAIGDALGVPYEFRTRTEMKSFPCTGMIGFGTHNQPPGTFSDDSSLTFCVAEALTRGYDVNQIAMNFVDWYTTGFWSAHGVVFDIGITTKKTIEGLIDGAAPLSAGCIDISSNGNASLVRTLPLTLLLIHIPISERYRIVSEVSSLTHRHIRSITGCFIAEEFARQLLANTDKRAAYHTMQNEVVKYLAGLDIEPTEMMAYDRILGTAIYTLPQNQIESSGYIVHTLEAAIWCVLTTNSYEEAVLQAVNLGNDTDSVAAVTGGLAGLIYGYDNVPPDWLKSLARQTEILSLAERFGAACLNGLE